MVAHGLVRSLRVSRSQIEQLIVRGIGPDAEGNADKARKPAARRRSGLERDLRLDSSVLEIGAWQHDEALAILLVNGDAHTLAVQVVGGHNRGLGGDKTGWIEKREGLDVSLGLGEEATGGGRGECAEIKPAFHHDLSVVGEGLGLKPLRMAMQSSGHREGQAEERQFVRTQ